MAKVHTSFTQVYVQILVFKNTLVKAWTREGGVLRGLQHPHLLAESCNCNAKKFTKQIDTNVLF